MRLFLILSLDDKDRFEYSTLAEGLVDKMVTVHDLEAVLFDIDGVLFRGDEILPGAKALLDYLSRQNIRFAFITNNSCHPSSHVHERFVSHNMAVAPEQIITSSMATRHYLQSYFAVGTPIYAIGMSNLMNDLFRDHYYCFNKQDPSVVVVGMDQHATYSKFRIACQAIRSGAHFVGTNPDISLPTSQGFVPETGASLAFLEAASGIKPVIVGKPSPIMFEAALKLLNADKNRTLVIGDNLDTDIAGAQRLGIATALVLTGITSRETLRTAVTVPSYVFQDLIELLAWLQGIES